MDTEKIYDTEYVRWLRGQLVSGEQLLIARETGYSHNYVRAVLSGTWKNAQIVSVAEGKVFGRLLTAVNEVSPLLRVRRDFGEQVREVVAASEAVREERLVS